MNTFTEYQYLEIADCTVQFIDDNFDASFMWTAHNEIDFKWDYIKTYDKGWFGSLNSTTNGDMASGFDRWSPSGNSFVN